MSWISRNKQASLEAGFSFTSPTSTGVSSWSANDIVICWPLRMVNSIDDVLRDILCTHPRPVDDAAVTLV